MEQQQQKRGIARRVGVGLVKALSYSLGITSLARTGQRIGGNLGALGKHVHRKLTDSPANYRHESFEEAVDRLGLDEAHLVRQARIFRRYAIWYFVATMTATAWLAYAPFTHRPINAVLMALGAIVISGLKWLKWNFHYCRIRDQEFHSFGHWIRSPGRW